MIVQGVQHLLVDGLLAAGEDGLLGLFGVGRGLAEGAFQEVDPLGFGRVGELAGGAGVDRADVDVGGAFAHLGEKALVAQHDRLQVLGQRQAGEHHVGASQFFDFCGGPAGGAGGQGGLHGLGVEIEHPHVLLGANQIAGKPATHLADADESVLHDSPSLGCVPEVRSRMVGLR